MIVLPLVADYSPNTGPLHIYGDAGRPTPGHDDAACGAVFCAG